MTGTKVRTGAERLDRLCERLTAPLVAQVPEDSWFCEFECPKLECTQADWDTCPVRKRMSSPGLVLTES